jgi:hypothetical protein
MTEDEYLLRSYKVGDFFDDFFESVVRGVDLGGSLRGRRAGLSGGFCPFCHGQQ